MGRKLPKKPIKKKEAPKSKAASGLMNDVAYAAPEANEPDSASTKKNLIAAQAVTQFEGGLRYKQKRMEIWTDIERTYNLEKEKVISPGRFDYPLPVLSGYVDTLHSKIDDEPYLEFEHQTLADKPRAKKVTAAWRFYSGSEHADWAAEDRAGKKMAIMTGRAIFITYCESDPVFATYFDLVDSYDYVAEPLAVGDIRKHRAGFQDNIFRSKWELENATHYDQAQVAKLVSSTLDKNCKRNQLLYRQKINRLISVGLDPNNYTDYSGDNLYRLTQGFTTYEGVMYWLVMDMSTGTWLRCDPIKEVFASGSHPYVSWATHFDKFNFWSKCPAEDVMPVARGMRDLYNEGMYNIKKRNSGQRAYDPDVFDEPELLEWRHDGLVPATVPAGKSIASGIYEFKTEDNTDITVNMFQFSDSMLGQKTGITAGAQGASDKDTKVGVYYGDLQQVADRLGLTNKYYVNCWRQAGDLFAWGLWEHFPAKLMVKIVGEEGVGWEELKKDDTDPDFSVVPKSGRAELEANEFKKKRMDEALSAVMLDPRYAPFINPIVSIQHKLRGAGWEEEEIRNIMDVQNVGDEPSLIKASQAIEDILEGKEPRVYQKATNAFLKKIKDYMDETELDLKTESKFVAYFAKMVPIVVKNVARRASIGASRFMLPPNVMPQGALPNGQQAPVQGTPQGTQSASQISTAAVAPQMAAPTQ